MGGNRSGGGGCGADMEQEGASDGAKNRICALAIFAVVFTFSQLQYSIENSAEDYESMSDWNAAKGLSWVIFFPITLISTVVLGFTLDVIRKRRHRS